jgi:hypothetical protein
VETVAVVLATNLPPVDEQKTNLSSPWNRLVRRCCQSSSASSLPSATAIAVRKRDPRLARIRQAIAAMYADGTMARILARWNMSSFALKK